HAGEGLLPRLTANMMGMDVAPEALQLDALGEIANVICGQVLPALHPVSAVEYLPPRVVTGAVNGDDEGPPSARIELGLETSRAELLLFLENEPAGASSSGCLSSMIPPSCGRS